MSSLAVRIGVPDETAANQLSRTLVEERIVAGTRMSSGTSHLEPLAELLDDEHPDELPGVTYTEIGASDEYLAWIEAETR